MEYIVIFGHDKSESKLRHQPAGERINNRPREPAIQNDFWQCVALNRIHLRKINYVRFSDAQEQRVVFSGKKSIKKRYILGTLVRPQTTVFFQALSTTEIWSASNLIYSIGVCVFIKYVIKKLLISLYWNY